MGKGYYIRTFTAGRYQKVVRYTRVLPGDSKSLRASKRAQTNAAQQYINIKNCAEKLQWLLCANYDSKDACFCTLTCKDDCLPKSRSEMKKRISSFVSLLRNEWKRQGRQLKSIYTVEGESLADSAEAVQADSLWEVSPWRNPKRWDVVDQDCDAENSDSSVRLHGHIFLLLGKADYDTVRSLWPYGHVYINRMKVNVITTFSKLASYVLKEARSGKRPRGERSYIPSLNLIQPEVSGHWCDEYESIAVPHGAESIKQESVQDDVYGTSMEYVFYRMPREKQDPKPYKRKGNLNRKN